MHAVGDSLLLATPEGGYHEAIVAAAASEQLWPEVLATLEKIEAFTHSIHSGEHKGYTGKAIKHIVAIGIGGSFLGPKIMTEALKPYQQDAVKVHFVANVDGCHITGVLAGMDHEDTLVVMSSKSFSTQETLQNY